MYYVVVCGCINFVFSRAVKEHTPEPEPTESTDVEMQEDSGSEREEESQPPQQPEEKREEAAPGDANKPVAINSVIGTPWCVVWTGDNRSFFYNAVSKESHWVMPDELKDNPQVEKLLSEPPKPKAKAKGKSTLFFTYTKFKI